jgi:hypothetical protein
MMGEFSHQRLYAFATNSKTLWFTNVEKKTL